MCLIVYDLNGHKVAQGVSDVGMAWIYKDKYKD